MNKKYNSINDSKSALLTNNKNVLELLTKLDQALHSSDSFVSTKTTDDKGNDVVSQIPTIGHFMAKLKQLSSSLESIAGIDSNESVLQIADNSFKRVITVDVNKEPNTISQVPTVTTFKTNPNWIFDNMLNPLISVEIDLTDKLNQNTKTILSSRYIVVFDKQVTVNTDGTEDIELTTTAKVRLQEFNDLFKNNNNIDINTFESWLTQPGLVNNNDEFLIDEDKFDLDANKIQYKGLFDVLKTDIDTVNKKLWYVLNTLTYNDISNDTVVQQTLNIGDQVFINSAQADSSTATIYEVAEISTINSDYKVRFTRVFGVEPIPIRQNALSIYSEVVQKQTVRISVGFDEYSVIFLKQLDPFSNVESTNFSPGVGFYTNELKLNDNNGEIFSEYYVDTVYDYGAILKDLVTKKIPNEYGIKPNAPLLDKTNFKVVQTNKHLTDTVDAERIRDLHNKKNNIASEITQIETAIEKQNKLVSTTDFDSATDKKRAEDKAEKLSQQLDTKNKTKITVINDILSSKKNLNKISPEYHLRGFWPMPDSVENSKTKPQEVVQFEVWYRKLSNSGDENPILTVDDINLSTINKTKNKNATFSNWIKFKTDSRKRVQNPITNEWEWQIEDVSDANTPNINQLDIVVLPGETIEFKVKSLSEVGWPEAPIESDFSNVLKFPFPDNLKSVLNDDEFILKEAQADEIKVKMETDLEARGLNKHLSSSIVDANTYFAHSSNGIASGFKRDNGTIISLYDKLIELSNKVDSLTEQINRAKGVLEIYLLIDGNKKRIFSGNNLEYNIQLEDVMSTTKIGLDYAPQTNSSRTYLNNTYLIDNYKLLVKNASQEGDVGILSYRGYGKPTGLQPSSFSYNPLNSTANDAFTQAIWSKPDGEILYNEITTNNTNQYTAPKAATQQNNQFIWLRLINFAGDSIYYNDNAHINGNKYIWETINSNIKSTGFYHVTHPTYNASYFSTLGTNTTPALQISEITNITDDNIWTNLETTSLNGNMGSAIVPVISDFSDIVEQSSTGVKIIQPGDTNDIVIPINIYTKNFTGTDSEGTTSGVELSDTDVTSITIDASNSNINATSGYLELTLSNAAAIKQFDKIVFDGFTDSSLIGINTRINKIVLISGNVITVDFKPTGALPGTFNGTIKQLHKRHNTLSQITAYNVYGDNVYVENYVEVVSQNSVTQHIKSLRFYMENQNDIKPMDFQLTFNIYQNKKIVIGGYGAVA